MRPESRRLAIGSLIAVAAALTLTACATEENAVTDSAAGAVAADTVPPCTGDNAGLTRSRTRCRGRRVT